MLGARFIPTIPQHKSFRLGRVAIVEADCVLSVLAPNTLRSRVKRSNQGPTLVLKIPPKKPSRVGKNGLNPQLIRLVLTGGALQSHEGVTITIT